MKISAFVYGLASFIPGVLKIISKGTGGTDNARYCYSVWLRHLVMAKKNGLNTNPEVVAELGPGDSLGIGLAALLSGSEIYYAFDVVEHSNKERNLQIFDQLVQLFEDRAPIPNNEEFSAVKPYIDSYEFPDGILDETRMQKALELERVKKIRDAILYNDEKNSIITYKAPWDDENVIEPESVDLIFSQAVLEHVDDLDSVYNFMYRWLKPGGYLSHQIDFKCHGTASEWNGHWQYSDFTWKLIKGRRPYLLNRMPHSVHVKNINKHGFRIICDDRYRMKSVFSLDELDARFGFMGDEDLVTSGAFIQAKK